MMMVNKYKPTIKDIFRMPLVGGGRISPNGSKAIYGLGSLDNFKDNEIEVSAYLYDSTTETTRQFSVGMGSQPRWVGHRVLTLSKPASNSDMQIHVFDGLVGESQQITNRSDGVLAYEHI